MEKKKKKPGTGAPKCAKRQSGYKARETTAAVSPVDDAVRMAFGKAKDPVRKS